MIRMIYSFFVIKAHCRPSIGRQLLTHIRTWYKNVAVVSTNLVISLPCKWRRIVDAYPPNCTAPPSLDLSSFRVCKHELGHCKCTRRSDVCVKVVTFGVSLTSPRLGRVVGRILHTLALEAGRTQRSFSKLHLHPLSSLQPLVCLFTLFAWYKVFFFYIICELMLILSCSFLYEMSISLSAGMLVSVQIVRDNKERHL